VSPTPGLSRAIYEEVRFDTEKVTGRDWSSHPTLRHADVPERIDIVLVNGDPNPNRPDLPPYGAGEHRSNRQWPQSPTRSTMLPPMRRHSTTRTTTPHTGASRPRQASGRTANPFEQISAAANAGVANSDHRYQTPADFRAESTRSSRKGTLRIRTPGP
jgi:hypothetical protein